MKYVFGINLSYSKYSSIDNGYCVYSVYGEDPNCDLGGSHHNPYLGDFEGTFEDVINHAANNMKGFYTWGGGGYIKPANNGKKPIIVNPTKKNQIERKEKLNHITKCNIDYLIENVENMSKEEIKENLLQIKNSL